ncbi:MAG: NADH-quinone oxidoreductase subunit NuoH [Acidobacteria bacterium]|nr:NADH-quinone oxidoreductase subunit NuoH [Acidobacteriota bacterium]
MDTIWQLISNPVVSEYVLQPLLVIIILIFVILTLAAYLTYAERKVSAFIQARLGPMRVGPWGLLQPLADGIKLLLKEDLIPARGDQSIFKIAPMLSLVCALVVLAVVPFGPGRATVTDINIGLLFILSVSSVGVLGIILGGWASNSKYPLLGALRSSAQMISYEVAIGLALIGPLMFAKTLSMTGIIEAQRADHIWYVFFQPAAFIVFLVAALAETNRAPFDLPEAEAELVAGFHTEYSGFRWGLYFVAEYINVVVSSAIAVTVFLGGWHFPFLSRLQPTHPNLFAALSILVFAAKVLAFLYLFMWVRWTLPRYRYDQLMDLGWKWMIPAMLGNIIITGAILVIGQALGLTRTIPTEFGQRLLTIWPQGKLYFIGAAFLISVPLTWILLAIINRRSYDFNLRTQRQIRLAERRASDEAFGQV